MNNPLYLETNMVELRLRIADFIRFVLTPCVVAIYFLITFASYWSI